MMLNDQETVGESQLTCMTLQFLPRRRWQCLPCELINTRFAPVPAAGRKLWMILKLTGLMTQLCRMVQQCPSLVVAPYAVDFQIFRGHAFLHECQFFDQGNRLDVSWLDVGFQPMQSYRMRSTNPRLNRTKQLVLFYDLKTPAEPKLRSRITRSHVLASSLFAHFLIERRPTSN